MSKLSLLLIGASACGFAPTERQVQPDAQSTTADADANAIAGADAQGTARAACHSQLPGLLLCYDFEDPTFQTTIYDSSAGDHDATPVDVDVMKRATQQAAGLADGSSILVPEAASLDLASALSIELWIDPGDSNSGPIIAHQDDYWIDFDRAIGCWVGDLEPWSPHDIPAGWHHIACTFDGTTMRTYVDGSVVACAKTHDPMTARAAQIRIGERYVGGIDDVHLYSRALEPAEIQGLAGATSATSTCP